MNQSNAGIESRINDYYPKIYTRPLLQQRGIFMYQPEPFKEK